jgi:hypothetical protein
VRERVVCPGADRCWGDGPTRSRAHTAIVLCGLAGGFTGRLRAPSSTAAHNPYSWGITVSADTACLVILVRAGRSQNRFAGAGDPLPVLQNPKVRIPGTRSRGASIAPP